MRKRFVGLVLFTLGFIGLLANAADYLLGLSLLPDGVIIIFLALVLIGMFLAKNK